MKKRLTAILFIIFSFQLELFCIDYKFSIEPFFGMKTGTLYEYALVRMSQTEDYKLSQLEWHINPAYLMGGTICSDFGALEFSTTVYGLNHITNGKMYDWDYENYDGKPTKFSAHPAELTNSLEASGNVAFRFEFDEAFSLAPFVNINYSHSSMTAHDGYYQYPTGNGYWNENLPTHDMQGRAVTYTNTMLYPSAGLQVRTNIWNCFGIQAGFSATPWVYATSVDKHWLRDLAITDKMYGGFGFFGDIKIDFSFKRYHTISFFASSETIQNVKGASTRNTIENAGTPVPNGRGGTAKTNYSFGFSYKLTID